jgi:hypothetical protein
LSSGGEQAMGVHIQEDSRPPHVAKYSQTEPKFLKVVTSLAIIGTTVILGIRFFRFISEYAVNIFFSDQWAFKDATLFGRHSLWQMFRWQYGPHRMGLGALLEVAIEPLFRWNTRTESFVIGIICVLITLCSLYLKKKLFGCLGFADVLIAALFLTPALYETLVLTGSFIQGPVPVLLVVLYCLAWTQANWKARYVSVLVLNILTIHTGYGALIGIVTPVALVLDYWGNGQRQVPIPAFVTALAVSAASLLSFFVGYRSDPGAGCFSWALNSAAGYVEYVDLMLGTFLAHKYRLVVGAAVGTLMIWGLVHSSRELVINKNKNKEETERLRYLVTFILISYCLLFCLATAYGRSCLGLISAISSRYVTYTQLGILGLYFHLLDIRPKTIRITMLTILTSASLFGASSITVYDQAVLSSLSQFKRDWKSCYLATASIETCDSRTHFGIYPDPKHVRLQEWLDYLKEHKLNLYVDASPDELQK